METFAEVRNHIMERYELTIDEPFIISFEFAMDNSNRRQSIFLAELESERGRRILRVETPVAPLSDLDDIAQCTRYIAQIARLAITVIQARKDTGRLQMTLHTHQVEPFQEPGLVHRPQ